MLNTKIIITTFVCILIFVVTTYVLLYQGRILLPESGSLYFRVSDAWSEQNSQHFSDPYSFSHLLHGILFFGMLYPLRKKLSLGCRLVIAMSIEALWEVVENSSYIIDRYRDAGALGYSGDTIINVWGDLLFCLGGFFLARYIGRKKSVILFLLIEVVMIRTIRDSLLLNIIALIHPIEAIKQWQSLML